MNTKALIPRLLGIGCFIIICGLVCWKIAGGLSHNDPQHHEAFVDKSEAAFVAEGAPISSEHLSMSAFSSPMGTRRNYSDYYKNRAYVGAPPQIPHAVSPDAAFAKDCNTCHEKGGYVPSMKAQVPITPHPHFINCVQCHVPANTDKLFRGIDWKTPEAPMLKQSALAGSPPIIPHDLQYRNNCLSCHSRPSAPVEIQCNHPERVNCTQCHVPQAPIAEFSRSLVKPEATNDEVKE